MKHLLKSQCALIISFFVFGFGLTYAGESGMKKWEKGKGWGWVWGPEDEVGSLNEMTEASKLAALKIAKTGKSYNLGVSYNRDSFKWPGHSPGEIMTFRTPEGVKRQGDFSPAETGTAWHSCALFMNDNVATQIDGLGHVVEGEDNHWYNGFTEADWGGDWGLRKCDSTTIPEIIARGVMIDMAGYKGVKALPAHYGITVDDLKGALNKQGTQLKPGDVVLIRTGSIQYWDDLADRDKLTAHDSSGLLLEGAKWLVEENGAMLIGSDTSGMEYGPSPDDFEAFMEKHGSFIPVHTYLLIRQGVHIGELHNLEELAMDKVYEFCYVCTTNMIEGTTAGFTLRPLALP
ncbi:MAG: cyclase [Opitutaceae bacterium]|nr:cyclase [Opitutaceae bacterium]|tara:strand:- start:19064 stop:20101 length:1038 start_codon:yes stop_codon:yes gene_type:complete